LGRDRADRRRRVRADTERVRVHGLPGARRCLRRPTASARRAARSRAGRSRAMSWRVSGSYFESCNCDPICPCRRIDGVPGGRSTHGECMGVLSWLIETGAAGGVDLSGLTVALAIRYSDDEEGSPWTWVLYLDARATAEQL